MALVPQTQIIQDKIAALQDEIQSLQVYLSEVEEAEPNPDAPQPITLEDFEGAVNQRVAGEMVGPPQPPQGEFDPPDFKDVSPEEQEAHQERKAALRTSKRDEAAAAERTSWGEDKLKEEGYTPADAADDDTNAETLFEAVHGGPFDPNSSMDRTKLDQITENLKKDEFKGLTPNQFALKMYREAA